MKRLITIIFSMIVPLMALAQTETQNNYHSIEIDARSLSAVQTDPISGVPIDKIGLDRSQRPCARIKMHINRMSREEIAELSVKAIGGNVEVMKQIVARQGNGLIIELTAKDPTRFYLHHPKYGDSNEVSLSLEGDKEYRLNAQLCQMQSIVVSTNVVGADVYVDGVYRGKSDSAYTLTVNDIMAGNHKIRVEQGALKREVDVFVSDTNIYFKVDVDTALSRPQYVVFQVVPVGASVVVGDKSCPLDSDGIAQMVLNNGSYNYTVSAKNYHSETGTFVVSGAKVEKSVTLRPAYGFLSVSGSGVLSGATVYVDGELLGAAPIKSDKLSSGVHNVRIVKSLYKVFDGKVTIKDGETLDYFPTLTADYATVLLSTGSDCDIYVNNNRVGKGSWRGDLATGAYIFEARKSGHRSSSISKSIEATSSPQSYTIPTPTPILGTLNVSSSPAMADLYVDGKSVGRTPIMVDLVVGEHEIALRKGELSTKPQSIYVAEGRVSNLTLTLEKQHKDYVETVAGLNMKMIYVEGGTFQMGATSEQGSNAPSTQKPVHSVTLSSYYIAECEITQSQWQKVMGTTVYQQRDKANTNWAMQGVGDNYPMYYVNWDEAQAFCRKLSELTGKRYMLPTEAQWEYAARGGNRSKGYKYSGSNNIAEVAWYKSNTTDGKTHPVKQKRPNELGLYDMSGNVYEWCYDWYGSYSATAKNNPTGPSTGTERIVRSGSFYSESSYSCVSYHGGKEPSKRFSNFGFRLVCVEEDDAWARPSSAKSEPAKLSSTNRQFVETVKDLNMKMVYVEGGTFQMGATSEQGEEAFGDEKPAHSVSLNPYYIGECEVTQAQWQKIMGTNPSKCKGNSMLPVETVSWDEAQAFCRRLSELTGRRYVLPTEAQWEYAARGGKRSGRYKYSGSNTVGNVAWYESNSGNKTHPVKQKQPNELGLYDMSGNVQEWCSDWYAKYASHLQAEPKGPTSGTTRVFRGGSKQSVPRGCRVPFRFNAPSTSRFEYVGFRVVCLP